MKNKTQKKRRRQHRLKLSDSRWKKKLTAKSYNVLRKAKTEQKFSSSLNKETRPGMFLCQGCGQALFSSTDKFNSGTGWPSFSKPTSPDDRLGMTRTEVLCSNCGGHLCNVFFDGPTPTGRRYCMNGAALTFRLH